MTAIFITENIIKEYNKDKVKEIEQLTKKVSEEPEKQLQEIKKCAAEILEEL